MNEADIQDLTVKVGNTLKYLMLSLMLDEEYQILQASFKKNKKAEDIVKSLLRCKSMFDSKHEIVKILVQV